jgi:hypothetical protein
MRGLQEARQHVRCDLTAAQKAAHIPSFVDRTVDSGALRRAEHVVGHPVTLKRRQAARARRPPVGDQRRRDLITNATSSSTHHATMIALPVTAAV